MSARKIRSTFYDRSREEQLRFNIKTHNEVSEKYKSLHGDIFSPVEQERLHTVLDEVIKMIKTDSRLLTALDYGCGSGNVTGHLIELGMETTSADISEAFLKIIERDFAQTGLSKTIRINGTDLSNINDAQFDLVATYSVLHHVPDYLFILKEMCRVIKPGGVLYIDHEVTDSYYERPREYIEFLQKAKPIIDWKRYLRLLIDVGGYKHIFRRLINPRYKREGDIHVWPDDRIEWQKIEQILTSLHFETVLKKNYLLCRNSYNRDVYEEYKNKCSDMRILAARKL
jgi:ubiquinone/menaquinone biosynthesis C-methylase UbiE